jgi:hypothetical protein
MPRPLEPGSTWTAATAASALLLDVTEELDDLAQMVGRDGLERRDMDDLDKLIGSARDLLVAVEAQTGKVRERYGWQ